ncbi:class Ib ribonucleoside-diphosphate reductase assembly flavoprotein NrdI [Shouchella clausii]|uniref:class Ib ribonucleoside-diphosphate reductase assembly flavoprotein NrdI n=1 Tax=Shouchella clausii TaxID=79880 RepID=UPI000BA5EEF2|nr:class Ib ribonucleoside-diphosphate reductase assembly flavoprotein NrdI [Shouchella clausii]PAD91647.1 class Ib ribonucleoside-diphosphate reductase assembly flavoprotein NrdI [Shouchella clausii]
MTLIAYYSKTGNTRRFVEKLEQPAVEITSGLTLAQPFVLVTPTYNFGQVPLEVTEFLYRNGDHLTAVIGAGNRVWGANYARAGRLVAEKYEVPLLGEIELAGTAQETENIRERLRLLDD